MYISVIIPGSKIPILTYKAAENIDYDIGELVFVPYRKTEKLGMILNINTSKPKNLDENKIKLITAKSDLPKISKEQIEFLKKSASYYLGDLSSFLKMTIPVNKFKNQQNHDHHKFLSFDNLATLSKEQEEAYLKIKEISSSGYNTTILDGVTGSGKTEIYFHLIADKLINTDTQILVIVPEIILTNQLITKFKQRFNFEPIIWHSDVTNSKKNLYWNEIISGNARVIIGTRSSLYLPYKKLGLIIIEEEHDNSYKQEEGVIYNARDMAILKCYIEKIPCILVSATPSIETYHNLTSQKYHIVNVKNRFYELPPSAVEIVDLKQDISPQSKWISNTLIEKIKTTLNNKNQALLFLNRRGYSPLLLCSNCGYRYTCKHCSSWMVEHRSRKRLECHYCGEFRAIPKICDECKTEGKLVSCGPGVEKIAEDIAKLFPGKKYIIMTKDTIKSPKDADEFVSKILNNEVDIIIGTQLIAKGHHFPNLALVGVIDADIGLNGGDLRAAEKTYQMLEQVSGRAGRENNIGNTIIQTYYPQNEIIQSISKHNKIGFYENELSIRKKSNMPPYAKIAIIQFSGHKIEKIRELISQILSNHKLESGVRILGPTECQPFIVRKKYRFKLLLIAPKKISIQNYIASSFNQIKFSSSIKVKIDIDPYNFL